MLELGEKSEEEHKKILEEVLAYKFSKSILVGPVFEKVSAKSGIKSFHEKGKLIEYLKNEPVKGCTVLIKGSRGMGLEKIFDLL